MAESYKPKNNNNLNDNKLCIITHKYTENYLS